MARVVSAAAGPLRVSRATFSDRAGVPIPVDDLALIEQGLPPVRNQLARRELVTRYRSKAVQSDSMDD